MQIRLTLKLKAIKFQYLSATFSMLLNLLGLSNYAAKDYDAASISYPAAGDCAAKYKYTLLLVTVLLSISIPCYNAASISYPAAGDCADII